MPTPNSLDNLKADLRTELIQRQVTELQASLANVKDVAALLPHDSFPTRDLDTARAALSAIPLQHPSETEHLQMLSNALASATRAIAELKDDNSYQSPREGGPYAATILEARLQSAQTQIDTAFQALEDTYGPDYSQTESVATIENQLAAEFDAAYPSSDFNSTNPSLDPDNIPGIRPSYSEQMEQWAYQRRDDAFNDRAIDAYLELPPASWAESITQHSSEVRPALLLVENCPQNAPSLADAPHLTTPSLSFPPPHDNVAIEDLTQAHTALHALRVEISDKALQTPALAELAGSIKNAEDSISFAFDKIEQEYGPAYSLDATLASQALHQLDTSITPPEANARVVDITDQQGHVYDALNKVIAEIDKTGLSKDQLNPDALKHAKSTIGRTYANDPALPGHLTAHTNQLAEAFVAVNDLSNKVEAIDIPMTDFNAIYAPLMEANLAIGRTFAEIEAKYGTEYSLENNAIIRQQPSETRAQLLDAATIATRAGSELSHVPSLEESINNDPARSAAERGLTDIAAQLKAAVPENIQSIAPTADRAAVQEDLNSTSDTVNDRLVDLDRLLDHNRELLIDAANMPKFPLTSETESSVYQILDATRDHVTQFMNDPTEEHARSLEKLEAALQTAQEHIDVIYPHLEHKAAHDVLNCFPSPPTEISH